MTEKSHFNMSKKTQKKLLIEIMEADEKDGLYKTNTMAQQTYGEWMRSNPSIPKLTVIEWFLNSIPQRFKNSLINECSDEIEQAKQTEKEQIIDAWEDGKDSFSTRNAEQYYNETYGNKS